ncbi:unnamed protein product [Orchesella dallaii]|uniref:F-box domain-containing protein n=1 Tax=Orchesella dallaii TaxID=48710 RepID=A0ABP1RA53_9HEXA
MSNANDTGSNPPTNPIPDPQSTLNSNSISNSMQTLFEIVFVPNNVPESSEDLRTDNDCAAGQDPFGIFDKEVLHKIFAHVTDPDDLKKCTQTCTKWKAWIEKEKHILLLFAEVIGHLKLPKNDLLKCRQVCKGWKKCVDKAYEKNPLHRSYEYMSLSKQENWKHDGIRFSESGQIEKFLDEMGSFTDNPFPGRCIEISYSFTNDEVKRPEPDDNFWPNAEKLLERFGQHVWYAFITYDCGRNNDPFATNVEVNLRNCLAKLPNLKKLYLDPEIFSSVPYLNIDGTQRELGVRQRVMNYFRLNPLEPMKNLETLSLGYSSANYIHYEMLRCNCSTLKRVDFGKYVFNHGFQFPNLEEANIRVETLNNLDQLDCFPVTMKKISIERAYRSRYRNDNPRHSPLSQFSFERVFRKLERFGKTLQLLELDVNLSPPPSAYKPLLPALERLTISVHGCADFLLELKNLKYLVMVKYDSNQWEGTRVKLHGFGNKMYESNIWKLMPALETLVVDECLESRVYQRKNLPMKVVERPKSKTQCVIC